MRPIDSTIVGERFHAGVGLLHPIVIRPDGVLIGGERRLAACRSLRWREIRTREFDFALIASCELAESAIRKDLPPSEIDAIRRALEPAEKAAAKERMGDGGKGAEISPPSRVTDKIGAFAGVVGRSVEKIAAACAAADAEPEKLGKVLADMDRTGRANGVYRRLQNIKAADAIRASPPLRRRGPYAAGLIDIPWAYELLGETETALTRGVLPYPTMTLADACAFPVSSLLAPDAAIGVWVTNFTFLEGYTSPC